MSNEIEQAGTGSAEGGSAIYASAASQQPAYSQPPAPAAEAASLGNWVLTLFVAGIPIVGFVMMLIWSFSASTPLGKKNWARAQLIWTVVLSIVAVIVGIWLSNEIKSLFQ